MDASLEDEKKPYDLIAHEDDAQPDPDEHLMLDQGAGRVWLVKVPRFLMERWSSVNVDDMHLATLRVYQPDPNSPNKKPRIILFLPPNTDNISNPNGLPTPPASQQSQTQSQPLPTSTNPKQPTPPSRNSTPTPTPNSRSNRPHFDPNTTFQTTGNEPDIYELEMINDSVDNQIVVAERPKDPLLLAYSGPSASNVNSRARTTILTGRIKHECNIRPAFSTMYRKQMRERHKKYNTPIRQIRMIEDAGVPGGRGGVNRLSSGVGLGAGGAFGDLIKTKPKQVKGTFERMARMPRNQLLDQLFVLFREQTRWAIRPLRERTQQPEVYLKEVLSEIAFLHRSGEFNGFWELKENFKDESMKAENVPGPSLSEDVKMENADDDDDDDDDDEDMEEVS